MNKFISILLSGLIVLNPILPIKIDAQENPPVVPSEVVINPDSLRQLILQQNYQVLNGLNRVYQAKVRVSMARAALLPKLNLGAVFSGVGFALAAVQFLTPFLNPGNWIELKATKTLLKAEGQSFYISQLNTYASAQSLYVTILSDMAIRKALLQKTENMQSLAHLVKTQYQFGLVSEADYRQAEAQAQISRIQLSQIDELLVQEFASLREMLALPLGPDIKLSDFHPVESAYENQTPIELLPTLLAKSPEVNQMNLITTAARESRWKIVFSFISGLTYGSAGGSSGFENLKPAGSFTFDFGVFPAYEMSNLHIEQYELQRKMIESAHAQAVETTLGGLQEAIRQLELANGAVANQEVVYKAQLEKYNLGTTDLLQVIVASNEYLNAKTLQVKAQASLDNFRITMHRMTLADQFAKIPECKIEEKSQTRKKKVTIEEACRPTSSSGPQSKNSPEVFN